MSLTTDTSSAEFVESSSNVSGVEPPRLAAHHKPRSAANWPTLRPTRPLGGAWGAPRSRARPIAVIVGVMLASSIALPAVWAQERPPQKIDALSIAGTVVAGGHGEVNISVVGCVKKEDHFVCNYFQKNPINSTADFKYGGASWTTKLVDNFRIDHPLVRGYFVNGLGQRTEVATLGKDDWIWAVQEFAGPTKEITSGRVVFLGLGNQSVVVSLADSGATEGVPKSR